MNADISLEQQFLTAQKSAVIEVADQGLASLARLVQSAAIDISPQFQRRDRWNHDKQSLLIESFFLNIPIPPIYLAEDESRIGSYAVIDGKQRLTSVGAFLSDQLQLRGLERVPDLNGLKFSDLPEGLQRALEMKSMRVTTLLRQSADDLKHEVFLRLNTGGEVLNAQEIRNVAYSGPLNDLIYRLAESDFLGQQFRTFPGTPSHRKMLDAEYVVRFLSFANGWRKFSGDVRAEMDAFMAAERFADPSRLQFLESLFTRSIQTVESIWGEEAFKWPGRDQAIAGLYDAKMIAISELSESETKAAAEQAGAVRNAIGILFSDSAFDEATRRGTNTPTRLRYRVSQVFAAIKHVVG